MATAALWSRARIAGASFTRFTTSGRIDNRWNFLHNAFAGKGITELAVKEAVPMELPDSGSFFNANLVYLLCSFALMQKNQKIKA